MFIPTEFLCVGMTERPSKGSKEKQTEEKLFISKVRQSPSGPTGLGVVSNNRPLKQAGSQMTIGWATGTAFTYPKGM